MHFELFHEDESNANGWNYKPVLICDLDNCPLCRVLLDTGKSRYSTRKKANLKRHQERAKVRNDPRERVPCLVVDTETNTPCTKKYADKVGLRKHLAGVDGTATWKAHSISDVKKAYPKIHYLVTRKADSHRSTGLTRRSITIAQKCRTIRRIQKIEASEEKKSDNLSPQPQKKRRIEKKARKDIEKS